VEHWAEERAGTISHMLDDTLRVTVACAAGVWTGVVEGVPGAVTQTRRISELDPHVREQLAGLLDRPPSSFALDYHLHEEGCA
jgi:hypothetical protein